LWFSNERKEQSFDSRELFAEFTLNTLGFIYRNRRKVSELIERHYFKVEGRRDVENWIKAQCEIVDAIISMEKMKAEVEFSTVELLSEADIVAFATSKVDKSKIPILIKRLKTKRYCHPRAVVFHSSKDEQNNHEDVEMDELMSLSREALASGDVDENTLERATPEKVAYYKGKLRELGYEKIILIFQSFGNHQRSPILKGTLPISLFSRN
jgi:hypothetical protein